MEPSLRLLRTIYRSQPITRRALGDQTGLSANRVNVLVSDLVARGVVREEVSQDGSPGRPPVLLSVNPEAGRAVGLDIGSTRSHAVLSDMSGRMLASVTHPTQTAPDPGVTIEWIARLIEEVCEAGRASPKGLAALGVGVGGIVNTQTGMVLDWPSAPAWMEGWRGLNVPLALSQRLGIEPVIVEDSVRAMGTTAYRCGAARDVASFLYIFLGNGIGSGIFIHGRPYSGSIGIAGELGHVMVDEEGPWCSCGNRGCLEVVASTSAVLQRARERLAEPGLMSTLRTCYERDELTLAALLSAARAGDKLAFQILDEAGTYIGQVLAIAVNLLGPELVVLGGPLAQDSAPQGGSILLEAVQRQVFLRALQHLSKQARIVCDDAAGREGELVGARGAALMALDRLFDSDQYLQRLLL